MKPHYRRLTREDRLNIANYLEAYCGVVDGEDETTDEVRLLIKKIWFKTREVSE